MLLHRHRSMLLGRWLSNLQFCSIQVAPLWISKRQGHRCCRGSPVSIAAAPATLALHGQQPLLKPVCTLRRREVYLPSACCTIWKLGSPSRGT